MIRVTKLSGKLYGHEINLDDSSNDSQQIQELIEFVECGDPIILVDDLKDLEKFDINPNDVIMTLKGED